MLINKTSFKYFFVGGTSTLIFLLLVVFQVEILNFDPVLAAVISNMIVITGTYLVVRKWVFKSQVSHKNAFIKYIIVIGIGLIINTVGMYISVHVFNFWYFISQLALFTLVAINNYLLNKLWTFNPSSN